MTAPTGLIIAAIVVTSVLGFALLSWYLYRAWKNSQKRKMQNSEDSVK
ncbi:MAG: hypothetical protein ACTSXA_04635 [Candidatus Heimdallarchaeota archaeon]